MYIKLAWRRDEDEIESLMSFARSLTNIIDCLTDDFYNVESFKNVPMSDSIAWLECMFIFALTWSICATGDVNSRTQLNELVLELVRGRMSEEMREQLGLDLATPAPIKPYVIPIPTDESIYKYRFVKEEGGGSWQLWSEDLKVT